MTFALLLANFGMGLLSLGFSAMNLAQGSAWLALANLVAFMVSFACCIFMAKVEGDSYGRHRSTSTPAHSHPSYASGGTVVGARGTLSIALNPRGAFVPVSSFDDTLERPIENAGIRAGEIRALRAWRVRGDCLFSVYMEDFEWSAYSPSRGDVDCSWLQGIFAFKERDDLDQYLERKLVAR